MLDRFLSVITKDPNKSKLNNKSVFSYNEVQRKGHYRVS